MTLLRSCAPALPALRVLAVAAASVLLTLAQAVTSSSTATAGQDAGTVQRSPDPSRQACSSSGEAMRYLVLFDEGTREATARREISRNCGEQTVYYPEISVGVATSADEGFAERIGSDRAFSAQRQRQTTGAASGESFAGDDRGTEPRSTGPKTVPRAEEAPEQWNLRLINADGDTRRVASDVIVGVLDSGIDAAHPDLADAVDEKLSAGCLSGKPDRAKDAWSPTTSGHGTHVAGIIAATGDGAGVSGVAPGVRLASIRVIDERGYVDPEAAVCGFMWAAEHGMRVTNSSYFIDPWDMSCSARDGSDVVREALTRAAEFANNAGTVNVAAATNEGVELTPASAADPQGCEALPASLRSTIAVSSTRHDRVKAGYSSYGLGVVTVAAPGGDGGTCVLSTVPGGYERQCGTSMAAPHVAGALALLASEEPAADPGELRHALTSTTRQLACPTDYDLTGNGKQDAYCTGYRAYNGFYGHGMIDVAAAVEAIAEDDSDTQDTGDKRAVAAKRSSKQQRTNPARGNPDTDRGEGDQEADMPGDRLIEHAYRQLARHLDAVIQR